MSPRCYEIAAQTDYRFFSPECVSTDFLALGSPRKPIERVLTKRRLVQHDYFRAQFLTTLYGGTKSQKDVVVALYELLR
jgi:hypothetical protein